MSYVTESTDVVVNSLTHSLDMAVESKSFVQYDAEQIYLTRKLHLDASNVDVAYCVKGL